MIEVSALPKLPPRRPDAHKGDFGRVLVVAGSRGMSGAAILCASAALRSGAGLVRVAVPEPILPIVAAGNPCYTTIPLPADDEGRIAGAAEAILLKAAQDNDVLAIGPGLGRSAQLDGLVANIVRQVKIPTVVDADGLNALGAKPQAKGAILTPHPGEFARLLGTDTGHVQSRRRELAAEFAKKHQAIVVLKGEATIVTDGDRIYQNNTGNPGMATGGTGDVLTGIIAALIGQGLEAFDAAQLAVYLHGWAGDMARDELGEISLTALDLLSFLPQAFRRL